MSGIRASAVAGSFYPGDAADLAAEVASYLAEGEARRPAGSAPKAIIAPHAGYMYSGPVAGCAYSQLAPLRGRVARVVLAGPAHRVHVAGIAVPATTAFATPLGAVPVDEEAIERLRGFPAVETSERAHALEHSLEVHLPFLLSVLGGFKLVPLVVGEAGAESVARVLEAVWGGEETVIVVSTDLSHYLPYESARRRDRETAQAILGFEPTLEPDEACGAAPVNGFLAAARRRGMAAELLDLRNSGDTAGGRDRVVGYAAFAFRERAGGA